jgi:hypothetical protein
MLLLPAQLIKQELLIIEFNTSKSIFLALHKKVLGVLAVANSSRPCAPAHLLCTLQSSRHGHPPAASICHVT